MAQEATLENWMTPPHNQWAFHNIPRVLKTETAPSDPARKTELPSSIQNDKIEAAFNLVLPFHDEPLNAKTWLEKTGTDALVILKDGKLVYETYARGNDQNTKHILFSISKSVNGLLLGILIDKAKKSGNTNLTLDSKLEDFFPGKQIGKTWRGATIRECIDMRSGVRFPEGTSEARAAGGWIPPVKTPQPTMSEHLFAMEEARSEEKNFWYSSTNSDMVGLALAQAQGKSYAKLLSEELLIPMGAESDVSVAVDAQGDARAAGGICASARDLAKMGQILLDGGKGVVPEWWVEDTIHNGDVQAWMNGAWGEMFKPIWGEKVAYRNGFYVQREEVIMCMGVFGQAIRVDLKNKTVLIKFSSQEKGVDRDNMALNHLGLQHFADIAASLS